VVEELLALPVRGVEERAGLLVAHLPDPGEEAEEVLRRVRERLRLVGDFEPSSLRWTWQPHQEWSDLWRRGLEPRRVTSRLVVSPTWKDPELGPGELLISVDPGLAFGTAEHPTTRGCLRLLDRTLRPGDEVADIGAGSGILSIAAAVLGASRVVAIEMDPWAATAARENVNANGVGDRVEVRTGTVGPDFLPDDPPFHGVVANIETGILIPLLPAFRRGLRPGGWLILSGVMTHEAGGVEQAALEAGFTPEDEDREGEWWAGCLRAG
jgi:ribosomal protein L11 methyltransferase